MMEFGEKIKHLREDKGMTQQTMAEHLYVTRQAVSRWECGARYPDLLTTKKIAELLETTIDELVSGEELNRKAEKEPILTAPVSNFIQTILYTIGAVSGLVMAISWGYICLEPVSAFVSRGQHWRSMISHMLMLAGYGIYFAAMATGIYFSVKGRLSPRRTGMIMGAIFLPDGLLPLVALISVGNISDNIINILFPGFGMLLEISCVVSFFMIEKRTSPVPVYLIGLYLMITEGWHIGQMLLHNSGEIGTVVVLSVSSLGKISVAGLLMYQAYIMTQKRKRAWKA